MNRLLFFLLAITLPFCIIQAQTTISGIVNDYAKVSAITGSTLDVSSTTGFASGDKILVIQMQGASINTTPSAMYGDIDSYGSAGVYEYTTIDLITGSSFELDNVLCNTYDVAGCVQVVRVAQYTDAEVVAPGVTAAAWNGSTGGIVAIEVSGTLSLSDDIDATGTGFRGGNFCSAFFSCGDNTWFGGPAGAGCPGGQKGEGIALAIPGQETNRGKIANGGGGSNRGNSGAGGGSNIGVGGHGGDFWSGCGPTSLWGVGGASLVYPVDLAFLGGGGGGGYRDNFQPTSAGQSGGGIVIIEGGVIDGGGNSIISNGADVTLITNDEGAGGGGGGGTILLKVDNITGTLNLSANGGKGGDTQNFLFSGNCHGPGGGGGGGYIGSTLPVWAVGVTTSTNGGAAGQILHTTGDCGFPSTHGAQPGTPGGEVFNLAPSLAGPVVDLGNDTTVCFGETITFDAGPDFDSYLWQDGSALQTYTSTNAEVITIEAVNGCGTAYDTVEVFQNPLPVVDLGTDVSFCDGLDTTFDAGAGFSSYVWQDASGAATFTTGAEGIYFVTVTDSNGCVNGDTVEVLEVFELPVVELGDDLLICEGEEASFDAGPGFAAYFWNTGPSSASITVMDTGLYQVAILDANNCPAADSAMLFFLPVDSCESFITIPNAFTPNSDGLNDVFAPFSGGAELSRFQMMIFDRWGTLIFQTDDKNTGWDGTYKGQPLELDTYIYVVDATGIREGAPFPIKRQGTITLLR